MSEREQVGPATYTPPDDLASSKDAEEMLRLRWIGAGDVPRGKVIEFMQSFAERFGRKQRQRGFDEAKEMAARHVRAMSIYNALGEDCSAGIAAAIRALEPKP